jgi:segregation and condensation protein A
VQPPEPIDPNFRIELPVFEGPLDLLLHLTRKHELDILDLPIAFVTEKYLEYLGLMKKLNLDVASEYLVMAATLAHIKSKMLLPTPPSDQDDDGEEEIDPRQELIRRLLEYQKYKQVAEELGSRGIAGRDVFPRGIPAPQAEGPAPLADIGLFKLLDAFQKVLKRAQKDLSFEIDAERISIQERMTQIVDRLKGVKNCQFEHLFEDVITTYDIVVTFLAVLEMAKMRMMRVYQQDPEAAIYLEYRVVAVDEETGEELTP